MNKLRLKALQNLDSTLPTDLDKKVQESISAGERNESKKDASLETSLVMGHLKQDLADKKANRELRSEYADKVYRFMCVWCGVVFFFLLCCSISNPKAEASFGMPTSVQLTLLGGTTATVIGLVGIVMNGLFHHKKD